jgi:hypothetical protein
VTVKPDDFATLKAMYPGTEIMADSGVDHVFIPKMPIFSGGAHLTLDALLRAGQHDGYPTRIFVERQIDGKGQNWKQYQILGRTWWAPSWNHITADMSIVSMLANHLVAFR